MFGYTIDLGELAKCRKMIEDHAECFGNIGVELGPEDPNPLWLGTLPAATNLATACRNLHTAARAQFSAAEEFLNGVAHELGEEGQSIGDTELANVATLRRTCTTLR